MPWEAQRALGQEGSPAPRCHGVPGFFQPKLAATWPSRASRVLRGPRAGRGHEHRCVSSAPAKGAASRGRQLQKVWDATILGDLRALFCGRASLGALRTRDVFWARRGTSSGSSPLPGAAPAVRSRRCGHIPRRTRSAWVGTSITPGFAAPAFAGHVPPLFGSSPRLR